MSPVFCAVRRLGLISRLRPTLISTTHIDACSVGLLALEQYAEKTASAGAVNLYIFCAGMGLVALGVLYFCMVRTDAWRPLLSAFIDRCFVLVCILLPPPLLPIDRTISDVHFTHNMLRGCCA